MLWLCKRDLHSDVFHRPVIAEQRDRQTCLCHNTCKSLLCLWMLAFVRVNQQGQLQNITNIRHYRFTISNLFIVKNKKVTLPFYIASSHHQLMNQRISSDAQTDSTWSMKVSWIEIHLLLIKGLNGRTKCQLMKSSSKINLSSKTIQTLDVKLCHVHNTIY